MLGAVAALVLSHGSRQASTSGRIRVVLTPDVAVSLPSTAERADLGPKFLADQFFAYLDGKVTYQVEAMNHRPKTEPTKTPDVMMSEFLRGVLDVMKEPEVREQRDILFNGWPGLEEVIIVPLPKNDAYVVRLRCYVVGDRLYSISIGYRMNSGRPENAEAFLSSLEIKPAAQPGPLKNPGPNFTTFEPTGGKFSIGMPFTPKEGEPLEAAHQQNEGPHRFLARYGNRVYGVLYRDLPPEAPSPTEEARIDLALQFAQALAEDAGTKKIGGPTNVTRDGRSFTKIVIGGGSERSGRVEATFVDRRFFCIYMAYPSGHTGSPDIDTFFNSFKLLK